MWVEWKRFYPGEATAVLFPWVSVRLELQGWSSWVWDFAWNFVFASVQGVARPCCLYFLSAPRVRSGQT